MVDRPELHANVLSRSSLYILQLFNSANVAEFDLLQGITQGLQFIQFEITFSLIFLIGFGEELEEFDKNLYFPHDEESFLIYKISMDVCSLFAQCITQLFIKACRLEIRNLQDRLRNTQEVVLRDVSGQLFSFHSFSFNDCSDLIPFALIYVIVLVHVLHTVRQFVDCLFLFFSLCSEEPTEHLCFDRLPLGGFAKWTTPSSAEFS